MKISLVNCSASILMMPRLCGVLRPACTPKCPLMRNHMFWQSRARRVLGGKLKTAFSPTGVKVLSDVLWKVHLFVKFLALPASSTVSVRVQTNLGGLMMFTECLLNIWQCQTEVSNWQMFLECHGISALTGLAESHITASFQHDPRGIGSCLSDCLPTDARSFASGSAEPCLPTKKANAK